jgi:hypothetical protein
MKKMESENPCKISYGIRGADIAGPSETILSNEPISGPFTDSNSQSTDKRSQNLENERNFYRAKCRRLACERDKLISTRRISVLERTVIRGS